jgi:DNA-nicking Smr family endonuclease
MSQDDELSMFREEMGDVTPLAQNDTVTTKTSSHSLASQLKRDALMQEEQHSKYQLSMQCEHWIAPHDPISYKQDGIQDGVFKNLRLGKYSLEARLTLTQMTLEQARDQLVQQLEKAFHKGDRVVLVQHGLGLKSKPQPGKLKSFVHMWLPHLPFVIAYHTAQPSHGGQAAAYVLLKKNPDQKLINREKHQKRY